MRLLQPDVTYIKNTLSFSSVMLHPISLIRYVVSDIFVSVSQPLVCRRDITKNTRKIGCFLLNFCLTDQQFCINGYCVDVAILQNFLIDIKCQRCHLQQCV